MHHYPAREFLLKIFAEELAELEKVT